MRRRNLGYNGFGAKILGVTTVENCDWDDSTYLALIEDDTIFGPDGIYGWLMNLWYRLMA